jgi:hypothetical protein
MRKRVVVLGRESKRKRESGHQGVGEYEYIMAMDEKKDSKARKRRRTETREPEHGYDDADNAKVDKRTKESD